MVWGVGLVFTSFYRAPCGTGQGALRREAAGPKVPRAAAGSHVLLELTWAPVVAVAWWCMYRVCVMGVGRSCPPAAARTNRARHLDALHGAKTRARRPGGDGDGGRYENENVGLPARPALESSVQVERSSRRVSPPRVGLLEHAWQCGRFLELTRLD